MLAPPFVEPGLRVEQMAPAGHSGAATSGQTFAADLTRTHGISTCQSHALTVLPKWFLSADIGLQYAPPTNLR